MLAVLDAHFLTIVIIVGSMMVTPFYVLPFMYSAAQLQSGAFAAIFPAGTEPADHVSNRHDTAFFGALCHLFSCAVFTDLS